MPNTDNYECPSCKRSTYIIKSFKKPEEGPPCPVCGTPMKQLSKFD
jgi:hypothetical protein